MRSIFKYGAHIIMCGLLLGLLRDEQSLRSRRFVSGR